MSAGGMIVRVPRSEVTWRDVPRIYKTRFQKLWKALAFNILAATIVLTVLILLPLLFGFALSGHSVLTGIMVASVITVVGHLYWKSFTLALNIKD